MEINVNLDNLDYAIRVIDGIIAGLSVLEYSANSVNLSGIELSSANLLDTIKSDISNAKTECNSILTAARVTKRLFDAHEAPAAIAFYGAVVNQDRISFGYEVDDINTKTVDESTKINSIQFQYDERHPLEINGDSGINIEQHELEEIFGDAFENIESNNNDSSVGKNNVRTGISHYDTFSFDDNSEQ